MADEVANVVVPQGTVEAASQSALETHEVLDQAAHQEIAQTEDEDYKWLTDRLDAHSASLTALQTELATTRGQIAALETLLNSNQEQSRLLIQTLTEQNANLLQSVTTLSESALLKSPPNNSTPNSENQESETVTVQEVAPEGVNEATRERAEERVPEKKRRRI